MSANYYARALAVTAAASSLADEVRETCLCPPCPGRGNDGHGMTHCAECCFGTGVEAELGCPVHYPHSSPAATSGREVAVPAAESTGRAGRATPAPCPPVDGQGS